MLTPIIELCDAKNRETELRKGNTADNTTLYSALQSAVNHLKAYGCEDGIHAGLIQALGYRELGGGTNGASESCNRYL
jgi:hypothetical protein